MNLNPEIEILKKKCLRLVKFIREMGGGEMMTEFADTVELTYLEKDKQGLKRILKDLSEWAKGLTPSGKELISSILLEVEVGHKSNVLKILDKGRIADDAEYRILLEYVDQYFSESSEKEAIEEANVLLSKYREAEED